MRNENACHRNDVGADTLYSSDLPEAEVQVKLDEVNKSIREVKQQQAGSKTAKGASIWLVPTYKAIDEWTPIAKRQLPDVEWEWQT